MASTNENMRSNSGSLLYNLTQLRTLTELDKRLVSLMKGKTGYQCPDINHQKYVPNDIEKEFSRKAQAEAMGAFFKYTLLGGLIGFSVASSRNRLVGVSLGAITGSTYGVSTATLNIMRKQIDLNGSPLAIECRYQLWKINPNHLWLKNYENDLQRWSKLTYYGNDASINHNYNSSALIDNNQLNNDNNNNNNNYNDADNKNKLNKMDNNVDIDNNDNNDNNDNDLDYKQQKRQKFYQNRKILGDNQVNVDNSHGDHLFDYERENKTKRQFNENKRKSKKTKKRNDDMYSFHQDNTKFSHDDDDEKMTWG